MKQEKEIWRPVVGYEGYYEVSNLGRVKSTKRTIMNRWGDMIIEGKILKPCIDNKGYLRVYLSKNNAKRTIRVHRLVGESFIPNPNNLQEINHKNEVKTDNRACNLEWCDRVYNVNYGTGINRRVTKQYRPVLCIELNVIFKSITEACEKMGLRSNSISACCKGKLKTTGGYHWKYANKKEA